MDILINLALSFPQTSIYAAAILLALWAGGKVFFHEDKYFKSFKKNLGVIAFVWLVLTVFSVFTNPINRPMVSNDRSALDVPLLEEETRPSRPSRMAAPSGVENKFDWKEKVREEGI